MSDVPGPALASLVRFIISDTLSLPPGGVLDGAGLDESKAGAILDGHDAPGVAADEQAELGARGAVGPGDRPPWSGPGGMLVQRQSWDQSELGRRKWPGWWSRPCGESGHNDRRCGRAVAEGRVRPNRIVVAAPALDQDLGLPD